MKSEASTVRLLAAVEWPKTVSKMCAAAHSSRPALDHSQTGRSRRGKSRARQMLAIAGEYGYGGRQISRRCDVVRAARQQDKRVHAHDCPQPVAHDLCELHSSSCAYRDRRIAHLQVIKLL